MSARMRDGNTEWLLDDRGLWWRIVHGRHVSAWVRDSGLTESGREARRILETKIARESMAAARRATRGSE